MLCAALIVPLLWNNSRLYYQQATKITKKITKRGIKLKFVNFGLVFVFCLVLSACGKSEHQAEVDKSNAWADKHLSYRPTGLTPCEVADTCKNYGQILEETRVMHAAAAGAKQK